MVEIQNLCPALNSTKSPSDRNEYRLVGLANGIEALLVSNSDDQKQKAACACAVQVGSFSDPAGRCEGLAHYCEHMLFLGSRRYPGEAQFEEFLSENGGYSNAYTECEFTSYYFEVNRKALHTALDMFAQLFHEPLFTPDSSSRELQAIESEFQKKKRSDGVRNEQLFASFAREDHPWTLFGWGNLQSLDEEPKRKGVELHAELQKFFHQHYKANRMRVCVFGIEPLDSLQDVVRQRFSPIRAPEDALQLDFAPCGLPLAADALPRLVRVRPIQDSHSLSMSWQLPSQLAYNLSKPESYLSHLVGDEGHGSILSLLKNEGLATELCAGAGGDNFSHSSNSMIFNVEVTLTELGVQKWAAVASYVFQYLKMLRGYGESLPSWPFEEKKLVSQMSYRFLQEKDPCDLAEELSVRMLPLYCYQPANLLDGPWMYQDFKQDLIVSALDGLSVKACFIMLSSSSYGRAGVKAESSSDDSESEGEGADELDPNDQAMAVDDEGVDQAVAKRPRQGEAVEDTADRTVQAPAQRLDPYVDAAAFTDSIQIERHFGTEYWVSAIDSALLQEWESATPDPRLRVPECNPYIATDFTLLSEEKEEECTLATFRRASAFKDFPALPDHVQIPVQVGSEQDMRVWFLNCAQRFKQPRSAATLKITSPYFALDPQNVRKEVLCELYACCLSDSLNEILYPASKAKLHCSVSSASHGISVNGSGFSQKLLPFMERILGSLGMEDYCSHAARRFAAQKEELLRDYVNSWIKPQAHCSALRRLLLLPANFRPAAKEKELSGVELSDLVSFVKEFLATLGCETLVSGNTPREELRSWADTCVAAVLKPKAQPLVQHDVFCVMPGSAAIFMETAIDVTQTNSALEIYWQFPGRDDWCWDEGRTRLAILFELLEEVMSEPLFDVLRTKQQLGYSVGCTNRDSHGVLGFSVYVLSAVQRPPVLLQRVEAFLDDFAVTLRDFPEEKFANHVVALAGRWLEPQRTLSDLHGTCYSEIAFGHPVFDRYERNAAVLGTVSLDELCKIFEEYMKPDAAGRACVITAVVPPSGGSDDEAQQLAAAYRGGTGHRHVFGTESEFHKASVMHAPRGSMKSTDVPMKIDSVASES